MVNGLVFDIKKFSLHDGPGIRTTVFLKGCPLRCVWCHNPESQLRDPQVMVRTSRCVGCGACVEVCPHGAVTRDSVTRDVVTQDVFFDATRCAACGACVAVCYAGAREWVGREMAVATVLADVLRDRPFYETSGGGVTFSGGEPLGQPAFLLALLQACRAAGVHTALDTCGYADWEVIDRIRPFVDLFLYDLKTLDDRQHRAWTGVSNALILENLRRLAGLGHRIWIRAPIVPGCNDSDAEMQQLAAFAAALPGVERLELLPYHGMARDKYRRLGLPYRLADLAEPAAERMETLASLLRGFGLPVYRLS
ncbi:MAG: glycyl-radical enzyme activating protein [Anaerolineae bacterium]|nr:glycyl-radical enzyme activating protein [Anaerolineae bacterium]